MNDKQLQLVTFNQAVALKKHGFNLETYEYYDPDDMFQYNDEGRALNFGKSRFNHNKKRIDPRFCKFISAPSIPLALKWFRDTKGLNAFCDNKYHGWHYDIYSIGNDAIRIDGNELQIFFETYEEAESALLDELLMLIENEK